MNQNFSQLKIIVCLQHETSAAQYDTLETDNHGVYNSGLSRPTNTIHINLYGDVWFNSVISNIFLAISTLEGLNGFAGSHWLFKK